MLMHGRRQRRDASPVPVLKPFDCARRCELFLNGLGRLVSHRAKRLLDGPSIRPSTRRIPLTFLGSLRGIQASSRSFCDNSCIWSRRRSAVILRPPCRSCARSAGKRERFAFRFHAAILSRRSDCQTKSPPKRALVRALESVRPTSRHCYSKQSEAEQRERSGFGDGTGNQGPRDAFHA